MRHHVERFTRIIRRTMAIAKLIISRPRVGPLERLSCRYRIAIDGSPDATIGPGARIEIELSPDLHRVRAMIGKTGGRPVAVDVGPEEIRALAVGANPRYRSALAVAGMLALLPQFVRFLRFVADGYGFDPRGVGIDWSGELLFLALSLLFALAVASRVFRRDALQLWEIPDPGMTDSQIAAILRPGRPRVRCTIRRMMFAVALLALCFWAMLVRARFERGRRFRSLAAYHRTYEKEYRGIEQRWIRATDRSKDARDVSDESRLAARAAARADYHAAMSDKYKLAADRGDLSVAPDPPAPPWP
jgi:hypothetical protein